jgi:hypothetical protein
MLKMTLAAAAVAALSFTPVFAESHAKLTCDDEGMMKVEMMMKEKMEMKVNTEMAMKENEMAMMAKKEGKAEDCAMHLNMAAEELMKAK